MDLGNLAEIVMHYLQIGGMTCLGEYISVCDSYWIGPMVNYDVRLSVVMIHWVTILYELLTLRGYWSYTEVNSRLWLMGDTLKWSHILMDWVNIGGWWQLVFLIKAPWYLMDWDNVSLWVIQRTCVLEDYGHNFSFSGNLT